jgi:putative peptide zinc metalloprotease protein
VANPFHSASWFSVARLRPRLKSHIRVRRHRYRGQRWYVIDDGAAGRAHRFPRGAYLLIGRLDGSRTVEQLWTALVAEIGEEAPAQDDVIAALGQLHGADLLASDGLPDTTEIADRQRKQRRQTWVQNLKSPMSLRLPLVDPDAFLSRTMTYLRPLFGRTGALLWLAVVAPAAILAASHWDALTGNLADRVLATGNLLLLSLCYPVVKLIHELGHGYAVKARGRQVREMGVMLLILVPVPYVDASAASALTSKWRRALVGAAGMIAELFVAALALYLWLLIEPGVLRAVLFNVMLIAGVSTLLINGNPLLRFDAYYILADLIEIPNLGQRANRFWGHLVDKYLFRTPDMAPFDATPGEKRWFLVYAPLAFAARMAMLIGIALFVAQAYFIVGVLIALWSLWSGIGLPLWRMGAHVFTGPQLARNRARAVRLTVGGMVAALVLLLVVPAPHHLATQGIVWLPDQAQVRAGADATIVRVAAREGAAVRRGELLVETANPVLAADVARLGWRMRELQAEADGELGLDRVKREISQLALADASEKYAVQAGRLGELQVPARADGRFVLAAAPARDLPGRHVKQGELIGYVTPGRADVARVAVSQDDVELVRGGLRGVRFWVADRPGRTWTGRVVREVPGGTFDLPSKALATDHGGVVPLDPRDAQGLRALNRVFLFDIALPPQLREVPFGTRVHVRLALSWEPLGRQMLRRLRQMFLARFDA